MPLGFAVLLLNVVLIVHTAKTGRFWPWAYVILFLPLFGAIAYIVAELAPEWFASYKGRQARRKINATFNPLGRYWLLRDELYIADTVANRAAFADECLSLNKFEEALAQYEAILARPMGDEPVFMLGKARAAFGLRKADLAVKTLEELKRRWPDYRSADGHLLYAMALEGAGRERDALKAYADVSGYYPGAEPRVRQAELLLRLGRKGEADALATDVMTTLRRAPSHVQRNQREWYVLAQRIVRS
jgi:hypothetical protein